MIPKSFLLATSVVIFVDQAIAQEQEAECEAVSIRCPVETGCEDPTSQFQANRTSPVDGVVRDHNGVDYPGARGTNILAAAGGTIERSYTSTSYGETVVIRHTDGSATLYAHLQTRGVAETNAVIAGDVIGTLNSTGRSTGDHLHFGYVPNGQIFGDANYIDPHPCIGIEVDGSITLSDNGSLADDAFRAAVDGFVVGETTVGASNTLAVNNLIPGNHILTVTAIIAPDNIGTLQIDLSNGWTFAGGTTFVSDELQQGESRNYSFTVPDIAPE